MPRHPKCVKLRNDANSSNWQEMLVFYFRQASHEDVEMARQMSQLSVRLVSLMTERGRFIEELKTVDNFYAKKMADHPMEVQEKDDQKVTHMLMMVDQLDLSARSKDVFVLKLEGSLEF